MDTYANVMRVSCNWTKEIRIGLGTLTSVHPTKPRVKISQGLSPVFVLLPEAKAMFITPFPAPTLLRRIAVIGCTIGYFFFYFYFEGALRRAHAAHACSSLARKGRKARECRCVDDNAHIVWFFD